MITIKLIYMQLEVGGWKGRRRGWCKTRWPLNPNTPCASFWCHCGGGEDGRDGEERVRNLNQRDFHLTMVRLFGIIVSFFFSANSKEFNRLILK